MSNENASARETVDEFVPATERFETGPTDGESEAAAGAHTTERARRLAALGASVFLAAGGGLAVLLVLRALLGGEAGSSAAATATPAFETGSAGGTANGLATGASGVRVGLPFAFGGVAGLGAVLGPALATVSGALVGRACEGLPREAARASGVGAAGGFLGLYLLVAVLSAAFTPDATATGPLAVGVVVPLVSGVAVTAGATAYALRRHELRWRRDRS